MLSSYEEEPLDKYSIVFEKLEWRPLPQATLTQIEHFSVAFIFQDRRKALEGI